MGRPKNLNEEQLDILFSCWKEADNYKDRLALIEKNLPNIPALKALKLMRKLASTDSRYLKMATRKKNVEEKEKNEKALKKEQKLLVKEQKRKERAERKKVKEEKKKQDKMLNKLYENLDADCVEELCKRIEPEFIFCNEPQQFVSNISCIYRIFSKEYDEISLSFCSKCRKMDEYIPIIKEVIKWKKENLKS